MKNSLHTSILVCCLFVISTIGITVSAAEQKIFKTNRVTHVFNTQHVFPLTQNKIQKVEGKVRFYNIAESSFANHLNNPSQAEKEWMVKHHDRMQVYAPFFNHFGVITPNGVEYTDHTEWYSNGLEYKDLYAIYDCENYPCRGQNQENQEMYDQAMLAEADPELPDWILKDSKGNQLYIPFNCNKNKEVPGTCPQFAADISNPAFRELWIQQMQTALKGGNYRGLFIDDVNINLHKSVSDGSQCTLASVYCNWTLSINQENWAGFVAEFTEEINIAFPDHEIVHNSVWFHVDPEDPLGPYLDRQVDAADYIALERGINDSGMKAGWGTFGVKSFLYFNDYLHERGRNMVHYIKINPLKNNQLTKDEGFSQDNPFFTQAVLPLKQLEYGLAGWLLVSDGHDLFGARKFNTPDDWWHGFDTNLGEALGDRYEDGQGLFRRDFMNGIVLVNGPVGPKNGPVTITLPKTFYTLAGGRVDGLSR